jgi:hypothetical protein
MKGYWRFPEISRLDEKAVHLGQHHHVFTHLIWDLDFYLVYSNEGNQIEWFDLTQIEALPLITAHRVFFDKIKSRIGAFES